MTDDDGLDRAGDIWYGISMTDELVIVDEMVYKQDFPLVCYRAQDGVMVAFCEDYLLAFPA